MTFQHFGQHLDLLLELLDDRIAVMLELEARERRHAEAEFLRPQHDPITLDHARRFEPLQTPADLRRRQRHLLAQLLMRGSSEALEHVEQREIEVIEFNHDGFLRKIAYRAILMHRVRRASDAYIRKRGNNRITNNDSGERTDSGPKPG